MNTKDSVIHLIREELSNKSVIQPLIILGFDCSYFTLDVSHIILEMAGFNKIEDDLIDWYYGLINKALKEINLYNLDDMLDKWSKDIYIELLEKKLKEKSLSLDNNVGGAQY